MMLVAATQEVIVNVCALQLLLMPENVTDMESISSGEHKNFVVRNSQCYIIFKNSILDQRIQILRSMGSI